MKFKVVKRCQEDLSSIHGLLKSFLPFARKRMGFNKPPTIFFQSDQGNAQKLLGKTAHYEPATKNITVYVMGKTVGASSATPLTRLLATLKRMAT